VFDVGFWEISLIAIVALVVVGPDRLPGMMRTAGQLIGRAKRTMRELKFDLEREAEFEEVGRLARNFSKNPLGDFSKTLTDPVDIEEPPDIAAVTDSTEPIDIEEPADIAAAVDSTDPIEINAATDIVDKDRTDVKAGS